VFVCVGGGGGGGIKTGRGPGFGVFLGGSSGLSLTPTVRARLGGQTAVCGNLFLSAEQPWIDHVSVWESDGKE